METLFGRRKSRPRQSSVSQDLSERSVPYDRLGPASKSPVPVSTVSQGLRGITSISAPITNPTLTSDGTEFNLFATNRTKNEHDRFSSFSTSSTLQRSQSPFSSSRTSTSTLSRGENQIPVPPKSATSNRLRRSEASDHSTHSFSDFGSLPHPPNSNNSIYPSQATIRPNSTATTRSDSYRSSRQDVSLPDSHSHYSHISQHFHHKQGTHDGFEFVRPNDDDVEALFEQVRLTRDLGELPNLSLDQKWQIVYNHEHIRWRDEKARDEQSKRDFDGIIPANSFPKDSPEWYVKKFLDQTITAKQAASLLVSLRTMPVR